MKATDTFSSRPFHRRRCDQGRDCGTHVARDLVLMTKLCLRRHNWTTMQKSFRQNTSISERRSTKIGPARTRRPEPPEPDL